MTRRELVTDDGFSGNAVLDTDGLARLKTGLGTHDADAFDVSFLGILVLDEVGETVDVDIRVGGGIVAHVMPRRNGGTLSNLSTEEGQSILVDRVTPFGPNLGSRREAEKLSDFTSGFASSRVLVVKRVDFSLVDRAVTKATFVGRFVDNHSVIHVVTRV